MNWYQFDRIWETGYSGEEWANWHHSEKADQPVIYPTLTQTFEALGGLAREPRTHLFLGVNPKTGGAEMIDLRRPRSFVIDDRHYAGAEILQTIVMGMKLRANQHNLPITVLTADSHYWDQLSEKYSGIKIASTHRNDPESINIISSLVYNAHKPHFLVIDDLSNLLWLDARTESILEILISSGAASNGVYVLTSIGPTRNIKSDNTLDGWTSHGNILHAETIDADTIHLSDGTNISVPRPE